MNASKATGLSKGRLTAAVVLASSLAIATVAAQSPTMMDTIKGVAITFGNDTGIYRKPIPSSATEPCLRGSRNCIRTAWIPPKGTSQQQAVRAIQNCLAQYPEDGQNGIDKGGWNVAVDHLVTNGSARVEFKSGVGFFAKYFNFGEPFVDDVLFAVPEDGQVVEVRSSARKGYDDTGVNQKRLQSLIKSLPKTWEAPDPEYR